MTAAAVLAVLVFMSAVMAAGWAFVIRTRNAGWTDVFWTFGTGAAGVACALIPLPGQMWPTARQGLVAALVAIWAVRLGLYVALRVASHPEDARYGHLREDWGAAFDRRAFWFLQVQAPATALLSLSILLAARRPFPETLRAADLAGLAILAIAIAGESLADRQMQAFKADPQNKGRVCEAGLWGWSRHPNYFFEWFGWLAYPVISSGSHGVYLMGWAAWGAPVLMYLVLDRGTGVPPLEAQMLKSRGDAFRDYQSRTSRFVPWPPRPPSA